jgi:hypothetical protein
MCLFSRVYSSNFINKMQVKHYNHSSKGRIAEIHLHSLKFIKPNPSCKPSTKKNAKDHQKEASFNKCATISAKTLMRAANFRPHQVASER